MINKCRFRESDGTRLLTAFTAWTISAYFKTPPDHELARGAEPDGRVG
jgi:hypothetical protein